MKNREKMESRWEAILASIFNRFWWIFKLGSKIKQSSIQKGIEKVNVSKSRKIKKSNYIRDSQLMGGFSRQDNRGAAHP